MCGFLLVILCVEGSWHSSLMFKDPRRCLQDIFLLVLGGFFRLLRGAVYLVVLLTLFWVCCFCLKIIFRSEFDEFVLHYEMSLVLSVIGC